MQPESRPQPPQTPPQPPLLQDAVPGGLAGADPADAGWGQAGLLMAALMLDSAGLYHEQIAEQLRAAAPGSYDD